MLSTAEFIMKISQWVLLRSKSNLQDPVVDYILILVVLILFLQSISIVWLMLEYFDMLRISLPTCTPHSDL